MESSVPKNRGFSRRPLETLSRVCNFLWTYAFLTFFGFHLPNFWNNLSFTPKFAAAVALPDLRLCQPNYFLSNSAFFFLDWLVKYHLPSCNNGFIQVFAITNLLKNKFLFWFFNSCGFNVLPKQYFIEQRADCSLDKCIQ